MRVQPALTNLDEASFSRLRLDAAPEPVNRGFVHRPRRGAAALTHDIDRVRRQLHLGPTRLRADAVSAGAERVAALRSATGVLGRAKTAAITHRSRGGGPADAIVVVGDGGSAAIIGHILTFSARNRRRTLSIVRVADWEEASTRLRTVRCDDIIVADRSMRTAPHLVDARNRPVAILPGSFVIERFLGWRPIEFCSDPSPMGLTRRRTAGRGYALLKRITDITAALTIGVAVAPLFLAISLILAAQGSPFEQEIVAGRGGRPVRTRRFRTPRFRSGDHDASVPPGADATLMPLGRFLRRTRLESLPVLWNLAAGTISLVGPRPERLGPAAERKLATPAHAGRQTVKPGLFAWSGRAGTRTRSHVHRGLEYDLYYAEYASPALDLAILASAARRCAEGISGEAMLLMRQSGHSVSKLIPTLKKSADLKEWRLEWPDDRRPETPRLQTTLLVGAGAGGRLLVKEMRRNPSWGFIPVGFVDDDPRLKRRRVAGLPVIGGSKEIPAIVARAGVDIVVIAVPSAPGITIARLAEVARGSSARVLTMPDIGMLLRGEASLTTLRPVDFSDVLGRPAVTPNTDRLRRFIAGRRVLITGAAGSIGQELTRQVAQLDPAQLVALDTNETGVFDLQADIGVLAPDIAFHPVVASVLNARRLASLFSHYRPEVVFHAAAYKHVPLMEKHPEEAVMINAIGTYHVAKAASAAGVERFVLVSSDKAVRPSSVMGATKRISELILQDVGAQTGLSTCCVRFGNVLGSRGSVIPTFVRQIDSGGPVTVTDPGMKRFFMTIPESASLIIQAGAFGDRNVIYMLDMGEEVSILDLAERMIRLRGLRVGQDIEITFSGLRPGEKLREELALDSEVTRPTMDPKIRVLESTRSNRDTMRIAEVIQHLQDVAVEGDTAQIRAAVFSVIAFADGPAPAVRPAPSHANRDLPIPVDAEAVGRLNLVPSMMFDDMSSQQSASAGT